MENVFLVSDSEESDLDDDTTKAPMTEPDPANIEFEFKKIGDKI